MIMNEQQEENKNQDFMPKAQVETMLEGIRGDFKVFGEKLEMVDTRLMNVENKLDRMEKDMKNQFMAFGEGQQVITDTLDRMEGEIKVINEKLDGKAEKSVADDHEKRIFKLEKTSLAV